MPLRIVFATEARLEMEDAVVWYDEQEAGLGDRFESEVYNTLLRILQDPGRFPSAGGTIQKARVEVFEKYNVYYRAERGFISVVSVFHGARNPAKLHRRLK